MRSFFLKLWAVCAAFFFVLTFVETWYSTEGWLEVYDEDVYSSFYVAFERLAEQVHRGEVTVEELRVRAGDNVEVVPVASLPEDIRERMAERTSHYELSWRDGTEQIIVPISDEDSALVLRSRPYLHRELFLRLLVALCMSLSSAAILALMFRRVQHRLVALEEAAAGIAAGDWETRVADVSEGPTQGLALAFNHMAESTAGVVSAQRHLLSAVSHELRTPLTQLQFGVEMMATEEEANERRKRLQALHGDIEQIDRLIGELLTYARLDLPVERGGEPARLDAPMEVLAQECQALMVIAGAVALELHPGGEPCPPLRVEKHHFRRAVRNVLTNALRHARARVTLRTEVSERHLRVVVDDDGPGIGLEDRQRAFEPFERLGAGGPGYGMGLAIVKRICERWEASCEIGDSPTGGCRFVILWPRSLSE